MERHHLALLHGREARGHQAQLLLRDGELDGHHLLPRAVLGDLLHRVEGLPADVDRVLDQEAVQVALEAGAARAVEAHGAAELVPVRECRPELAVEARDAEILVHERRRGGDGAVEAVVALVGRLLVRGRARAADVTLGALRGHGDVPCPRRAHAALRARLARGEVRGAAPGRPGPRA